MNNQVNTNLKLNKGHGRDIFFLFLNKNGGQNVIRFNLRSQLKKIVKESMLVGILSF